MNPDERYPISECCACQVAVEESDTSIAMVCSHCSQPCVALFAKDDRPFICGDKVPEHINRSKDCLGIHGLVVLKCDKPFHKGAEYHEFVAVDERGISHYMCIRKDMKRIELASPF